MRLWGWNSNRVQNGLFNYQPCHSDEFKLRIEAMCAHIQAEYDVLLRSKSQLKQYFQRLSDKPFLHIETYTYQPLYKAGNIFGMMARDRQIDEI